VPNEADTCRRFVLPALDEAGWGDLQIREQVTFTDGRIVVMGGIPRRGRQKRADYILRYNRDFPIAVLEAKASYRNQADGLQQAKEYAELLGLSFAFSTNGHRIVEHDYLTGRETELDGFPSPENLWQRLRQARGPADDSAAATVVAPLHQSLGREMRYYQEIAINRAVLALVQGKRRVLLTMATGTGKTMVAFQICWRLWTSRWNHWRSPPASHPVPGRPQHPRGRPQGQDVRAVRRRTPQDRG